MSTFDDLARAARKDLDRILLGPLAPPRRRPRRIAKRIRQRYGRLRHSPFNLGCKRPRSAS